MRNVLRSAMGGILALSAVNVSAAFTGVSLGFSWLSGGVALFMGAPGVVGLLLINAIFTFL